MTIRNFKIARVVSDRLGNAFRIMGNVPGLDAYKAELDEKVQILQNLLDNYNAGRQKSLYCIAVNLLELADVKEVMAQIEEAAKPDCSIKEKALAAASLFKKMAQKRDISLKLNKPESSKK